MKIVCETNIINRQFPHAKPRAQKSTVAIGTHPPNQENTEFYILVFNSQHKTGLRYKIKDNIQKVFTKCLNEGKIQIAFKEPEFDLQIKGDAVQVKAFVNVFKLALQGKKTNDNGQQVISHVTAVTKHDAVKTKLVLHSRKEYPIRGFPRTLTHLEMSEMRCCRVDSQVYLLKNLTHLDLHTNAIEKIPNQLGELRLKEINFASNNLAGTNWKWLTGKELSQSLVTLNLSDNELPFIPFPIYKLKNLTKLIISKNQITQLQFAIRNMRSLKHLDLSSNKLEYIPHNLIYLRLDHLNVYDNSFNNYYSRIQSSPNVSTLFELAARRVISQRIPYSPATVPQIIIDIIEASPMCHCGKICVDPIRTTRTYRMLLDLRCQDLMKDDLEPLPVKSVFCSHKCTYACLKR